MSFFSCVTLNPLAPIRHCAVIFFFPFCLFEFCLSVTIGYSWWGISIPLHCSTKLLSFCSCCSHLIMLLWHSPHDSPISLSLSGLITAERLQCKRWETNGKQIQSTHCLINQVVWCSPTPLLPDNAPSPCVFCTLPCADGETVWSECKHSFA